MKCIRCNKKEAEVIVAGKKLCKNCAKNEIITRLRKNIRNLEDNSMINIYFKFNFNISKIIENILKYNKIDMYMIDVQYNKIDMYMWRLIIESKNIIKNNPNIKIITPFTADFLAAYTMYSAITGEFRYVDFINYEININNNIKIYQPFYNITTFELKVINEDFQITSTNDKLFDKIYSWVLNNLKDHEEIFRSFRNSLPLLESSNGRACKLCGAKISSTASEYCESCATLVASSSQS